MKTANFKPKTNQEAVNFSLKIPQISIVSNEADYYDYEADLAEEKAHYLQLRYGY
jgi:hypothetical protein